MYNYSYEFYFKKIMFLSKILEFFDCMQIKRYWVYDWLSFIFYYNINIKNGIIC